MITRKQYLNRRLNDWEGHRAYYSQFVTPLMVDKVAIEIGHERIMASTDKHLNDIPLSDWDDLRITPAKSFEDLGDIPTSAGLVCVAKEAARQYKEARAEVTN